MTIDPGGPLTDAELRDFVRKLARFAEHELDQFANWQIDTTYGPVYVAISRKLAPGGPADAFESIWPPLDNSNVAAQSEEDASGG